MTVHTESSDLFALYIPSMLLNIVSKSGGGRLFRDHAPATFYNALSGSYFICYKRQTHSDDAREPFYILLLRLDEVSKWIGLLLGIDARRRWHGGMLAPTRGGRGGWCAKNTAAAVRQLRSR